MKATLNKFTTASLYEASKAMLERLNIRYKTQSKEPINFKSLYTRVTSPQLPKSLVSVLSKVKESYYIGAIDEDTLKGRDSQFDIEKLCGDKYQTMLVFAIEVDSEVSITRSEYATLTRGFNRITASIPVIVYIKKGNSISIATCERTEYRQNWRDGEKLGKVSILKDIDCENPHRGHLDILESLKCNKAYTSFENLYQHWRRVFSTELLTEKFYTELSEWYAWVIGSGKVKFPNNINTPDDDTKYNHEAVIRLITRLIFVWFLKQKNLIPDMFFNKEEIQSYFIENFDPSNTSQLLYNPEESKYYRLILQNLFFAILNRPIRDDESGEGINRRFVTDKRYHGKSTDFNINNLLRYRDEFKAGGAEKFLDTANSQIPFLNGGLFECLDRKDEGMYYDGFSENATIRKQLSFPDYFFFADERDVNLELWYSDTKRNHVKVKGIVNILRRYNFTVEENTPLDQEVSLDPELLGKVFENLLAAYNPETNTTARKQTGSFYTPRPIVQYMVDESLIAYFNRVCPNICVDRLRILLNYTDEQFETSEDEKEAILSAVFSCKVLDPACGSGAFPMGVLLQMVHILRKVDPSNEMLKAFVLDRFASNPLGDRSEDENISVSSDDIENVFNKSINDPDYARKLYLIENCIYGIDIQPIATQISKLRFFISLVAEQKPTLNSDENFGIRTLPNLEAKIVAANSLIPLGKGDLFTESEKIQEIKNNLTVQHHKLFQAKRNADKKRIREKIKCIQKVYTDELKAIGAVDDSGALLLAEWDMFDQNVCARFFDSQWMFGIKDGFDIVVGNPPYIPLQRSSGANRKLYDKCGYETFDKQGDMYCLFYELGANLAKRNGIVCYITSNKWMKSGYGKKLRNYFAYRTNPLILIDFCGVKVFKAAVDTNILLFAKEPNQKETLSITLPKSGVDNLSDFVQHHSSKCSFTSSNSWVNLSPIEQSIKNKIVAIGKPLKEWDVQINYGIKTGCNEAFIITTEKRNEILSNCKDEIERTRTEALIRPILRGRDIKRHGYEWANLWLINTHNGIKGKMSRIHIEDYPAVKAHLDQYWDKISARTDKGDTPYNLRNCAYMDDFSKPKIVYPETTLGAYFTIDREGLFVDKTCFLMRTDYPLYIQSTLSSALFEYAFKHMFASVGLGDNGYQYNKHALEMLPLAKIHKDSVMSDEELYKLYKLCDEEIKYIMDNTTKYGLSSNENNDIVKTASRKEQERP